MTVVLMAVLKPMEKKVIRMQVPLSDGVMEAVGPSTVSVTRATSRIPIINYSASTIMHPQVVGMPGGATVRVLPS